MHSRRYVKLGGGGGDTHSPKLNCLLHLHTGGLCIPFSSSCPIAVRPRTRTRREIQWMISQTQHSVPADLLPCWQAFSISRRRRANLRIAFFSSFPPFFYLWEGTTRWGTLRIPKSEMAPPPHCPLDPYFENSHRTGQRPVVPHWSIYMALHTTLWMFYFVP